MPIIKTTKRRPWQPKPRQAQEGRKVDDSKFYNSSAWRKTAKAYRSENPLCEVSLDKGLTVAAQMVDHIIPVRQGGDQYDSRNLMAMCHKIHNRKSGKEKTKPILIPYKLTTEGTKVPVDKQDIINLLNN